MSLFSYKSKWPISIKGFTLIELLIVIGVTGVLVSAIIIMINPLEQSARAKDAGRIQQISQLSKSLTQYTISNNGIYPVYTGWNTILQSSGNLKADPPLIKYAGGTTACTVQAVNNYCYWANVGDMTQALVWTRLESQKYIEKCTSASGGTKTIPIAYWSSLDGQTMLICTANLNVLGYTVTNALHSPPGKQDF